jgi:hypothetical protein
MAMIQLAVEQGADLDKLSKLMDLQERWEKNEARKAFITAKAAFYREAPEITKNKHVVHNDFWHATLDHIVEQVAPVLAKHGLTHSWSTSQDEKGIAVACILTHELGHSEQVSLRAAADMSGSKNAVQGVGSTITYLERYTFLAVTGLAAKNEDKDGRSNADFVTTDQADELQLLAESAGADKARFFKFIGAESFSTIPAAKFSAAKASLLKKAGK